MRSARSLRTDQSPLGACSPIQHARATSGSGPLLQYGEGIPITHARAFYADLTEAASRAALATTAQTPTSLMAVLLVLFVLSGVFSAMAVADRQCVATARAAPNVTMVMVAPNGSASAAWIVHPNCSVEVVAMNRDSDSYWTLNCSTKGIGRIESLPRDIERLYFDSNFATEADFTAYPKLKHIILAWCGLETVERFKFPASLQELDFEGNRLRGIADGTIPNRVKILYLGENGIDSIDNFSLPSYLTDLVLVADEFTSLNFSIPEGLERLNMDRSKALKTIENVIMPDSLKSLSCGECGVETFRGVQLSYALSFLNFTETSLMEFEIRESDAARLETVTVYGDISQTTCRDADAKLLKVHPNVTACVITDSHFEAKYPDRVRPSSHASSGSPPDGPSRTVPGSSNSSSSSPPTTTIIIAVAAGIGCALIAVLVYRKCIRRAESPSYRQTTDDKYHDASVLAMGGLSGSATAYSAAASVFAPQEYLSNDIRNDEALITYRIMYDEVQILHEIAQGGFGIIHLGRLRGREVAVKQMLPEKAKDMRVVRSFMDEIRLCASLEHPRIVQFIGITWSTLQDMAVVLEYMAGGDLHAMLRGKNGESHPTEWFEESLVLKAKSALALDIADGLVYLHSFESPIIHRDLKARNILLNGDGDAKLSDFGISREAILDETMTSEIGTVAWIAPEVLRGERYSEKADIYSLGVLLVELDTARHPYKRELSETSGTLQSNTRIALLVSAGKLAPSPSADCPPDVMTLITSCLNYDPQSRPSAMDVHYELRTIFK